MNKIDFSCVDIKDGFWKKRIDTVSEVSVYNVYKRFEETGRFKALSCNWKKGEPSEPHIFWDSDVAKWIESVAFILEKRNKPELEKLVDDAVDAIAQNADESGYFNSCYLVHDKPRWSDRTDHELYCAGHFTEAAVAYYKATGKDKLLNVMKKYLDYIYDVFIVNGTASFKTPGHEEIELALIKLYELCNDKKYLDMCSFFVNNRGTAEETEYNGVNRKYSQSHLPVREQTTAEGHSVRACYLYTGMADLARITNDSELFSACDAVFDDIVNRKMYITGGIGSSKRGEAFTLPYDLPDLTAYSESCAALSLAWFAQRMLLIKNDSKYADTIERILYNNALSSVSLDGKSFFYVNPLAIRTHLLNRHTSQLNPRDDLPITQRLEVFDCSCCPPNITRFVASVADFMYTEDDDTVYLHQYISSVSEFDNKKIIQHTDYPNGGRVEINSENIKNIALRIPSWCEDYSITVNGREAEFTLLNGYAVIKNLDSSAKIVFDMEIEPFIVYPSAKVRDCIHRVAVQRGPVVYCAEYAQNGFSPMLFTLDSKTSFKTEMNDAYGTFNVKCSGKITEESNELYSRKKNTEKPCEILLIPYFAFANENESDMEVFLYYS